MAAMAAGASPSSAQSGPLAVVEQAFAAQSAGDVAAAIQFYDSAASVQGGACQPLACIGAPAIRQKMQLEATQGASLRILGGIEVGNVATGRYEATSSQLPSGVHVVGDFTAFVNGGKITSLILGLDASDPGTAVVLRTLQGLPATTETTGTAGTTVAGRQRGAERVTGDDGGGGKLGLAGLVGLAGVAGLAGLTRAVERGRRRDGRVAARGIASARRADR